MALLIVRFRFSLRDFWLFALTTPLDITSLVAFRLAHIRLLGKDGVSPKATARLGPRTRCPANNSRRNSEGDHRCCSIKHKRARGVKRGRP